MRWGLIAVAVNAAFVAAASVPVVPGSAPANIGNRGNTATASNGALVTLPKAPHVALTVASRGVGSAATSGTAAGKLEPGLVKLQQEVLTLYREMRTADEKMRAASETLRNCGMLPCNILKPGHAQRLYEERQQESYVAERRFRETLLRLPPLAASPGLSAAISSRVNTSPSYVSCMKDVLRKRAGVIGWRWNFAVMFCVFQTDVSPDFPASLFVNTNDETFTVTFQGNTLRIIAAPRL